MQTTLERISYMCEKENVKVGNLEKKIGASKGVLSRAIKQNTDIQSKWISKIVENYPKYNPMWLLTGKGEMLKNTLTEIVKKKSIGVPLIPVEAMAGLSVGSVSIMENDIMEYYNVPDFHDIDFMIRVKGSSMYPKYNSGDVVACKIINHETFIQWNKTHVIATKEQGVLVKRLKKCKENNDNLLAISDNESYDPFEIPKNEILNIALIKGVIRLE